MRWAAIGRVQECHIGRDFLLIYEPNANKVNFVCLGTHAELFE